jgi:hypothetical protein
MNMLRKVLQEPTNGFLLLAKLNCEQRRSLVTSNPIKPASQQGWPVFTNGEHYENGNRQNKKESFEENSWHHSSRPQ